MNEKAKAKAIEIINKFRLALRTDNPSWEIEYKRCALIHIEGIIEICHIEGFELKTKPIQKLIDRLAFWQSVEDEIKKLM